VGEGGRVVSLEAEPRHADVARRNIADAGLAERIAVRTGRAADTLPTLQGDPPFDFVFIDADKPNNPLYLDWAIRLSRPGALIVVDNVVRRGRVADPSSADPNVQGVRRMAEMIAAEPRLSATAVQTVGSKGYDGFVLAVVTAG
jgi:predicted O-methyltransferase YrrM